MNILTKGILTIGFSQKQRCSNCNNLTNFKIQEEYLKHSILCFPFLTQYFSIQKTCIVCEASEIFPRSERKDRAIQELESAKDINKNFYNKLNDKSKKLIDKRLSSYKAYNLIKYFNT